MKILSVSPQEVGKPGGIVATYASQAEERLEVADQPEPIGKFSLSSEDWPGLTGGGQVSRGESEVRGEGDQERGQLCDEENVKKPWRKATPSIKRLSQSARKVRDQCKFIVCQR